jgi:2-polyprenyl-3-methyl-5-hydroxy-6-metoxy-1,4-benzoquinol methylase
MSRPAPARATMTPEVTGGSDAVGSPGERRPADYWEERARRFAHQGAGLAAVCSYGMPLLYNAAIHLSQWLALRPWLRVAPGTTVLDVGCGVGRWSRRLARRGASVTGVDLSPTMVGEAVRRAGRDGTASRCRFEVGDIARLDLKRRFDLVLGVTVLQHLLDDESLEQGVRALALHLAPGGRIVLLEAAPSRGARHRDSAVFRARSADAYLAAFRRAGLRCLKIGGVDPAPFKIAYLPRYARLPRPWALAGLAAVLGASLPVDVLAGRSWVEASWHKVFVLERSGETAHGG